ncbi:unnamed protein product [Spirodela intermedia]|uniref:Uncharacterized protein n=1 Tax=Spirodela intermedia TaxID=51605 RepID=A0A7I8KIA7_SPIIN|nr:unnamed protein product [Spirodela intermedia]
MRHDAGILLALFCILLASLVASVSTAWPGQATYKLTRRIRGLARGFVAVRQEEWASTAEIATTSTIKTDSQSAQTADSQLQASTANLSSIAAADDAFPHGPRLLAAPAASALWVAL